MLQKIEEQPHLTMTNLNSEWYPELVCPNCGVFYKYCYCGTISKLKTYSVFQIFNAPIAILFCEKLG